MRIASLQLNPTIGDLARNAARIEDAVRRATAAGADLCVTPELSLVGYPPRDLLLNSSFVEATGTALADLARRLRGLAPTLVGAPEVNRGAGRPLFNSTMLLQDGAVGAAFRKSLLPTYDVFDEDRYFEPARLVEPMRLGDVRLGVTICEDVWNDRDFWPSRLYHRDPVEELAGLFVNISASPFTLEKSDLRRRMIRQEAVTHERYFLYVNQVGGNDELVFDGHSIGIAPSGHEVVRGRAFDEDLVLCDIPVRDDGMPPPEVLPLYDASPEQEAYDALVLGLGDYTRKCGFTSAVLGLSGGIDSALTACLAADALGAEQVTGVAMPTRYSSAGSVADAEALAKNLGIGYHLVPIDAIYQSYLDAVTPLFEGRARDTAEENLQARTRGAVLMALSNKFGSILLTTGNKSELAVGYCTLYGDMAGGLAVISDVPKTLVYRVSRYVNRHREIIPATTLSKPPSAELRPDQRDSDSLPPYEILDPIIQAYVEDHLGADAIVARGFDRAVVLDVLRLVDNSEYKRRQAAPGLKISSTAFGVGRRFPIAADYRAMRGR